MAIRAHRRLVASVAAVGIGWGAGAATASVPPSPPEVDPGALTFLDTAVIDELIAASENGSVDCAALNGFMTIGLLAGFAGMDESGGEHAAEFFFAVGAPILVPLLSRASDPDEPAQVEVLELIRAQLGAVVVELGVLGLTQDDLLFLQEAFARSLIDPDSDFGEDTNPAAEERLAALEGTDFESITFTDESDSDQGDDSLPWGDTCPETVAQFDFDFEDVSVSATFELDITITVPADTTA
ncbi:hypothetical protein BH24ACT5_BH24ACT5_09510 [soil metagenome]